MDLVFERLEVSIEALVYVLGVFLYRTHLHAPLNALLMREKLSPENQFKRNKNRRSLIMSNRVWRLTQAACILTAFFGFISLFSYAVLFSLGDPKAANGIVNLNNIFMQFAVFLLILAIFFDWPKRKKP